MRELDRGRRRVLRLLVFGAVAGAVFEKAAAQPAARGAVPPRRQPAVRHQPTVVIDPGHGGIDPGAVSPSGAQEKDIVLSAAQQLARQLAATRRYRAVLTRSTDEFIPLRDRVARARARKADLFLSIHADALPDGGMRGLSVFTLSAQASDREAAALAARENRADLVGGIDLARQPHEVGNVLMDLARRQAGNLSILLARDVVDQLAREVVLLDHPQRSADFAVLTAPDVPSVLVELGCLSNRQEGRLLLQQAYQKKLVRGLARAVEAYFAASA
jgi:N-acetylmuramoyl-L-alanine amidase